MRSHESTQGATAPNFENCRECACAFCGVSAAAPKQASCAASPAARPWPLPGRLGRPLCGMGKPGKSKVEGRRSKVGRDALCRVRGDLGGTRFVASAVARTKPGPPFQELPNPPEAVSQSDAPWRSRKVWVRAHDACINATASGPLARTARRRTSFLTSAR